MAHNVGNNIGVSKTTGILDLYTKNVEGTPYQGFEGSAYSLQTGNQALGGCNIIGGFMEDNDAIPSGRHSGTYRIKYNGESGAQHNDMDIFVNKTIREKPEPAKFFG
jgi:hypothetical protein